MNTELIEKGGEQASGPVDVAILMCTYNGAAYLREQLESFQAQSFQNWTLYVSDDSSTDSTRSILAEYQRQWGENRLITFEGPCQGFGKNFISLLKRPEVQASYYAFSDQDDVWFSDKLERSIESLKATTVYTPSLYCSRTRLVNASGEVIGFSPLFSRPPSFRNALVQSLAGANTMLINHAARELLCLIPDDATIVAHDWLTYMIIAGCSGYTVFDSAPSLDYRQHGGNLIGANMSFHDRISRIRKMLSGRFIQWTDTNLQILDTLSPRLSDDSRTALKYFALGRKMRLPARLSALHKSGVYRQTTAGSASLFIAACLGQL
ncbi:glycosyltransferase family 2 protein [Pseudomonas viridiflava]|uniref:glycosyltransferase family 2 protein n=1 Tax=Pseudomonas viridiflava TaxID=33069 RepID=UPI00217FC714|nr:glycosyltransferase family 2 protein [Pseudomonas viridiflava]